MSGHEDTRDAHDAFDGEPPAEAVEALREAMDLQVQGRVDAALEAGAAIVERWPGYGQAQSWLGQTLVTRARRFADGLTVLDRALEVAADDPYVWYTSGWCREFVANALDRPKRAHQAVDVTPQVLYAQARAAFLHALTLEPDEQLQGDIEDMLDVVANATGEPWDESEVTRALPRPR
jgi:tetratricopeptide (TPR) repeat protein